VRQLIQAGLLVLVGATAGAQSITGAVLAKREPHHHLVYEDSVLRVLRVRVPAHDTTLLHEHDPDYFWIALGASTLVNAKPGTPDATISSANLSMHYAPGHFAHVARNPGTAPFDNITVELLEPQANVRNLCETVLADKPLDCSATRQTSVVGATEQPEFQTNTLRVSLATIEPGAVLRTATPARRTWVIALDTADVRRGLALDGGNWIGGTFRSPPEKPWTIKNQSRAPIKVITVVHM
jgi:hypothetical protein